MDAALVVLTSSLGRTILGNSIVTIGRAPDNTFVISDPTVSAHHAEIRPDQSGYSLVDLGSTNGTFVNDRRLTRDLPQHLQPGDVCRLGSFTFTYEEYPSLRPGAVIGTNPLTDDDRDPIPTGNLRGLPPDDDDEYLYLDIDPLPSTPGNLPPGSTPGGSANHESTDDEKSLDSPGPPLQYQGGTGLAQEPGGSRGDESTDDDRGPYLPEPPQYKPGRGFIISRGSAPEQQAPPHYSGTYSPSSASPKLEYLQFAAFYPRFVPVETWNTLLVYAYIKSALQAVRADAHKFHEQLGPDPFQVDAWASHPLARGEQITIVPTVQGITFNPESISFTWIKDWHRAVFSFGADRRWAGAVGSGEILVFSGPLIIASFKLSLRFSQQSIRHNHTVEEVAAQRYRKIFTSYSHDDTPIVQAIRQAYQVLGDQSFLDIEHLRSGQNWNAELLRMIDSSDIFQLFWSARSAQSAYVRQEYQYALQHYKYDGFIRPVYWEKPMKPPPPAELARLHFAYYELPQWAASQKNTLLSRLSGLFTHK